MPKIDPPAWREGEGGGNAVFGAGNGPYADVPLGDAAGLTQFGVRLERLAPGSRSSYRHRHETEDEFVYLLSGELLLIEDEETLLRAGDAAAWSAGAPVAHCLENRSSSDATVLVVGARRPSDRVHYPDHDIVMHRDGTDCRFTRPDGSPVSSGS
ncbi:MAG: hypothetical protein CMM61_15850 [Rhodospirillaceae bacterium]|nr:hypothetical protein [Rhodospirillaceae bacterium]